MLCPRVSISLALPQTIGASFLQKRINIEGNKLTLQIWDTAGQERFRAMAPLYYRNAKAAIVVFDVTDHKTFRKAKGWVEGKLCAHGSVSCRQRCAHGLSVPNLTPNLLRHLPAELKKHVPHNIVMALAANKIDHLKDNGGAQEVAAVTNEELEAYVAECGATLFRTSAKTNTGVEPLFKYVGQQMLKNYFKEQQQQLLRMREHRSSIHSGGGGDEYLRDREKSIENRISLGSSRTNSKAQEGCC